MRNKHEHARALFLSVRAGIENIARKLEADHVLSEGPAYTMGSPELLAQLVALAEDAETRASTLMEAIGLEEEAMEAAAVATPKQPLYANELDLGEANIRIKDPTDREDDGHEGVLRVRGWGGGKGSGAVCFTRQPPGAADDFEEDMEDDVLDRDTLKKQSTLILDKANKGKKKRRGKKKGGEE